MADNGKKLVEQITSMDEDFAKWYTDIVKKADLIDYSSVKGCMIIRPYGYAIWENIQKILPVVPSGVRLRMLTCAPSIGIAPRAVVTCTTR